MLNFSSIPFFSYYLGLFYYLYYPLIKRLYFNNLKYYICTLLKIKKLLLKTCKSLKSLCRRLFIDDCIQSNSF